MTLHCDWVLNQWGAGFQKKQGRIEADLPGGPALEATMLEILATKYGDGSYFFLTDPHTDEECPFKDSDELPMRPFDVKSSE